jgi:1,4-dihydroxy-2-naphthoate octaprenyltransferase
MMATSLTLGLLFSYLYNSPLFLILTVAGNLIGWFYTAHPIRLSYRGWGEIVTILSGFLIPGLGFAAISSVINYQFLIFSVPIMLFYVLFILSVEIPDRKADKIGGKNTFIVRFGLTSALVLMVVASALASISFLIIPPEIFYPVNLNILALLSTIPLISAILTLVYRESSLNKRVSMNVNALVLFVAMVNVYLFII